MSEDLFSYQVPEGGCGVEHCGIPKSKLLQPYSSGEIDPFDSPGAPRLPKAPESQEQIETELLRLYDPKGQKFRKADHNARTRDLYEKRGYWVLRVDQTCVTFAGRQYTMDFLGLWDMMGMRLVERELEPGKAVLWAEVLGIQLTSLAAIGDHVRDLCSTAETPFNNFPGPKGRVQGTKRENLRRWLGMGFGGVVIGWGQEEGRGSRWHPRERSLTIETLEQVEAGKRLKHK